MGQKPILDNVLAGNHYVKFSHTLWLPLSIPYHPLSLMHLLLFLPISMHRRTIPGAQHSLSPFLPTSTILADVEGEAAPKVLVGNNAVYATVVLGTVDGEGNSLMTCAHRAGLVR